MSAAESGMLQQKSNLPYPAGGSNVPLLGEGFQESRVEQTSKSAASSDNESASGAANDGAKSGKRRLFGLGKKKKADDKKAADTKDESTPQMISGNADVPIAQPTAQRVSQSSPPTQHQSPGSPQRALYSTSPRIVAPASPAGSQIFERDVQESALPVPSSPAIPSHIQRENHIPPVLDASSEAITNNRLDPDTVEIVMHSSHQPAAVTVTGVQSSDSMSGSALWQDDLVAHPDKDDAASNYGALDSADVRRLSFISFSDIVQSEHMEHAGGRDHVAGLSSLSSHNRSPSPIRSPVSSPGFGTSPPTSKSASIKGLDLSPRGKSLASPTLPHSPTTGGELTIETMSQALRRTGSGDFSGVRSPLSPTSPDARSDASFRP